jgi:hypothetical protein
MRGEREREGERERGRERERERERAEKKPDVFQLIRSKVTFIK